MKSLLRTFSFNSYIWLALAVLVALVFVCAPGGFSPLEIGIVAVYAAQGLRDETLNETVGKALMGGPMKWQTVTRLRRDAHDVSASCWLHGHTCCFSAS